ncbi:hypothetical protein [Ulvibacter litoralis]|uniref:Glutaredoxin n=1 Tax=Ulvibacter litoralis TaxID=227084 RepID=A0A1G7FEZ4_9FLAO|nr:hypothetical protein [Ulvibacter litoralis]GHC51437.1 hypothetical protein GCM10008083_13890 [Ulvibacter litoralis]SDE74417.1 hypothetical protein SAMN05421855_102517 [Ulvibacter litoralis]
MLKKLFLLLLTITCTTPLFAQDEPIKIIEEKVVNRLMLYAVNETDTDYDVTITVEGTDFRQSTAKPRAIRVPATSKVNVSRLMLIKGKDPKYTYKLKVTDSLSRRALRKKFDLIKVNPKKQITVYITENCKGCDSIMKPLQDSKYKFTSYNLAEKPEIKNQLKMAIPAIETMETPVFSLGGLLFPDIVNYDELIEELNKEKK